MERIESFLARRIQEGTLRELRELESRTPGRVVENGRELIDFSSNDYLALSNDPRLVDAAKSALDKWGVGSGASRLMSGSLSPHHDLEAEVASFEQKEAGIVFNSGYQANTSLIPALVGRGDVIFADRLSHASQIDGALLSGAKLFRYEHNNPADLARLIEKERGNYGEALILTETVFSMDGDIALLSEIVDIKERSNCLLLIDEAHASGAFGRGIACAMGLADKIDIIMGTFSKGFGGFGAYAACSSVMKQYLVNSARGFIYSTSLPASVICADLEAMRIVLSNPEMSTDLQKKAGIFREALKKQGWEVLGESQVVPVVVGESGAALELAAKLDDAGIRALAIRPPTVPKGSARIRFSVTLAHSQSDLDYTLEVMNGLR